MSKDGECHLTITLELNINLTTGGEVNASLAALSEKSKNMVQEDDDVELTIPDFLSGMKLEFGKSVQE